MNKIKTILFFGGRSVEHEVSMLSARSIAQHLDKTKYDLSLIGITKTGEWHYCADHRILDSVSIKKPLEISQIGPQVSIFSTKGCPQIINTQSGTLLQNFDIAFSIIHGPFGEDGSIQGLFKMFDVPYVGPGIIGSAAAMDKHVMKKLFASEQIPTAQYVLLTPETPKTYQELVTRLGSPFFIKPANSGSSVGVHKVKSETEFLSQLQDAFQYDRKVLAEEFIKGREVEIAVLGNEKARASIAGEIMPHHEFYSYEAKYVDENGASLQIPAELDPQVAQQLKTIAIQAFHALECEGISRVDFFVTADNKIYVNEINTLPGFTHISMYPKLWDKSGISYPDLLDQILQLALARHKRETALKTTI